MNEVRAGDIQFSVKQSMFGLVVLVRRGVPDNSPGTWIWGSWRKAGQSELNTILAKLSEIGRR